MPGPRNPKKKSKSKKKAKANAKPRPLPPIPVDPPPGTQSSSSDEDLPRTPAPRIAERSEAIQILDIRDVLRDADAEPIPEIFTKEPFIHDPGSGPRVRDMHAFLGSSFALPPALDDALCAEFAQAEVLEMLYELLPEETAQILWYNKSRRRARVCPACQRLYQLGDVLREPFADGAEPPPEAQSLSPHLAREQELSGLCSPVCFLLASYDHPELIASVWGRTGEELDDATWDALDSAGGAEDDLGLGLLLKMTRCHDLGLAQLLFPGLSADGGGEGEDDRWGDTGDLGERMGRLAVEPET